MAEPVLHVEHLVKVFGAGRAAVRAVDDVSLDVGASELVIVMGPSGSGKTTLVSMLGALLSPNSGRIVIDGVDITALDSAGLAELRARTIGFVFQAFNLLDALSVEENILFPAHLAPGGTRAARPRADHLMERLNLSHRRNALPKTLSGGEKQRVAIARALINGPRLIFADEPTGNLDSQSGQEVMMILHDVARDQGCSVVLVTHDPRVEDVADRILWLEDGALRDRKAEPHSWIRDPVCGMRVDEWTATLSSDHGGKRYVFCSRRCLERFEEEPERYSPAADSG
jgi:putative ABC transport system ATP-binding protein